jgi:hypothetical protein
LISILKSDFITNSKIVKQVDATNFHFQNRGRIINKKLSYQNMHQIDVKLGYGIGKNIVSFMVCT